MAHFYKQQTRGKIKGARIMDLQKHFDLDEDKELNGEWFEISDMRLLIARTNNDNYKRIFIEKTRKHDVAIRRGFYKGKEGEKKSDKIICECIAEAILLNWENVEDEGKKIAYSKKNALKMLLKYKLFRELVAECADRQEAFMRNHEKETEKNLPKPSSGT
jgi:hypothetical protein